MKILSALVQSICYEASNNILSTNRMQEILMIIQGDEFTNMQNRIDQFIENKQNEIEN